MVTIGAYDGVHLGHRAVIAEVKLRAAELGARSAVVTFDRHPAVGRATRVGAAAPHRSRADARSCSRRPASTTRSCSRSTSAAPQESAEDFVEEVLVDCLHARVVVVGEDFHFGHHRRGNVALLREMGATHGFEVEPLRLGRPTTGDRDGGVVDGDPPGARRRRRRRRPPRCSAATTRCWGPVVEGDGAAASSASRPRTWPCRRDRPPGRRHLRRVVRAARRSVHPAASSLGRRPTFYADQPYSLLEAYLLDFDGDLYGELAKVRFVAKLRDEVRFDSVEASSSRCGLTWPRPGPVLVA